MQQNAGTAWSECFLHLQLKCLGNVGEPLTLLDLCAWSSQWRYVWIQKVTNWRSNTVPAVRKDACTLLSLQAKKPKNLLLEHVWFGGLGEVGGTLENHTHRCLWSLNYLAERKVRKTATIIFRVFNTSNSSPILLFLSPETLDSIFLENTKRRAPGNDRDLPYQKLIRSHMMPFGVNSDPSFRAPKKKNSR